MNTYKRKVIIYYSVFVLLCFYSTFQVKIGLHNRQNYGTHVTSTSIEAGGSSPPVNSAMILSSIANAYNAYNAASSSNVSASPDSNARSDTVVATSNTPEGNFHLSKTGNTVVSNGGTVTFSSSSSTSSSSSSSSVPANDVTDIVKTTEVASPLVPDMFVNYTLKDVDMKIYSMGVSNISDFSVSSNGKVAIISNNILSIYDFLTKQFVPSSDFTNLQKVSLAPDGAPYIVTNDNEAFFYSDINNGWIKLPVCAIDIAVGKKGDVYVIECQKNEILQINCQSGPNNRLIKNNPHLYENPQCGFLNLQGKGTKIEVMQEGVPIVISDYGKVLYFYNNQWNSFFGMYGIDVSISNEGLVFVIAGDENIYSINYFVEPPILSKMSVTGVAIESGPYSLPFVIGKDKNLYSPDSFYFN